MKKKRLLIWIIVLVLVAAVIWYVKQHIDSQVIVLQTEHPQYGDISTSITSTGTIEPVDTVAVGTQVSGVIKQVYVDFNSLVKKGELIAQLDKSLLIAQVLQDSASLAQAKDNLVYQVSNYSRQKGLFQVGAISQADYETALNTYSTAKDIVQNAQAQLYSANKNLSYADIYSPIDGTVLSRNVSVGQTVAASFSTPTLFSIARDLTKMQVQAAVDEADIGNVKSGQRVSFNVDAFPNDVFNGTVEEVRLEPSVSANVVTYVTIIAAPNADLKLKPGMTANITIFTREVPHALTVSAKDTRFEPDSILEKKYKVVYLPGMQQSDAPISLSQRTEMALQPALPDTTTDTAAHHRGKTAFVWLLQDSSIVEKAIQVGIQNNIEEQVLNGLTDSDKIVTSYSQVKKAVANSSGGINSPFLPHPPPRGNNQRRGGGPPP